jgi:hypothetical protein
MLARIVRAKDTCWAIGNSFGYGWKSTTSGSSVVRTDRERIGMELNLPPQRNGAYSPGGHSRTFYAPDLTQEELTTAICAQFVADSVKK